MKRKRFVKLMMGIGFSRNHASFIANYIPISSIELFGVSTELTYLRAWNAFRARHRIMQLAAKGGEPPEA